MSKIALVFFLFLQFFTFSLAAKNKLKTQELDPAAMTQIEDLKSEINRLQSIYNQTETESIKQALLEIQNSGDFLMSKSIHEQTNFSVIQNIYTELDKTIDALSSITNKIKDIAPKLQNEYVIPISEQQQKVLLQSSCANIVNHICDYLQDWVSEIERLNSHLYIARAHTITDLTKENENIKALIEEYNKNQNLDKLVKLTQLMTKTISKIQELAGDLLPAFEISSKIIAAK